jgi:hypothetical protein
MPMMLLQSLLPYYNNFQKMFVENLMKVMRLTPLIPDVISDETGRLLLQAMKDLADKMVVTIEYQ